MKKSVILSSLFLTVLMILFVACEDNPPTIVQGDTKELFVIASVTMRPYIDCSGNITPLYGQNHEIDSILFADSLCEIQNYGSFIEGNRYNYHFRYSNKGDSLRFNSGDTTALKIFKGTEFVQTNIVLLAMPEDSIILISPPDSVGLSDDVIISWNKIDNADWYNIKYYYNYDTALIFGSVIDDFVDGVTDTTYTISGPHLYNGGYRIHISAVSGPVPGATGNIESESIVGAIYSHAVPGVSYGHYVKVGSGLLTIPPDDNFIDQQHSTDWLNELYFNSQK